MISPFVSEQSISHAYEEIASCKTELQQAKRIRRNRQGITNSSKTGWQKMTQKHSETCMLFHYFATVLYNYMQCTVYLTCNCDHCHSVAKLTSYKLLLLISANKLFLLSNLEYDALAKVISQHPERQETLK